MWRRIRARKRASGSPGKLEARTTTALSAVASRSTASLARSLSFQTWTAVNATKRPTSITSGGSIPGETALNARALPRREGHDNRVNCYRDEVGDAEDHHCHPSDREVMQPIAHVVPLVLPVSRSSTVSRPSNGSQIVRNAQKIPYRLQADCVARSSRCEFSGRFVLRSVPSSLRKT